MQYIKHVPECFICLEPIKKNNANLRCGHDCHTQCIYEWLSSVNNNRGMTCPVCLSPVTLTKPNKVCRYTACIIL